MLDTLIELHMSAKTGRKNHIKQQKHLDHRHQVHQSEHFRFNCFSVRSGILFHWFWSSSEIELSPETLCCCCRIRADYFIIFPSLQSSPPHISSSHIATATCLCSYDESSLIEEVSTEVRAPHHTTPCMRELANSHLSSALNFALISHTNHIFHNSPYSPLFLPLHVIVVLALLWIVLEWFYLLKLEAVFEIFQLYVENDDWSRTTSWRAKNVVQMEWALFILNF